MLKQKVEGLIRAYHIKEPEFYFLKKLISCIDLTSLEGADTHTSITALCQYAKELTGPPSIQQPAAVCVFPTFACTVREQLMGSGIRTACVAGAFPHGQSSIDVKLNEINWAIRQGAEEIDTVINRGLLLEGKEDHLLAEIMAIKEVCGDVHLKVILETGELADEGLIREASLLAIEGGADFLKTSTGKFQPAASLEAVYIMSEVIKKVSDSSGKVIGIKAAGGISTVESALEYFKLVGATLGETWLQPDRFRIGASRLAGRLLSRIKEIELEK